MNNIMMSKTREEVLELAIAACLRAEGALVQHEEGHLGAEELYSVATAYTNVADSWVQIAKELNGGPRPAPTQNITQLQHVFPEGLPQVRHTATD